MANETILVVDDEQLIRRSIAKRLSTVGYTVLEAENGKAALEQAAKGVDLAILDYRLPDLDGLSVLKQIRQVDPDVLVILLTAYASVDTAVEAMKLGAYHFMNKPFDLEALATMVEQALETTRLRREVRQLRATQAEPYSLERIVGESTALREFKALLKRVATSPASTVLLTGESGTGKDLTAKILHYSSARAARPFVNITCSALPETLLESELFGHERGAFTDAHQQKKGLFEQADGGTVFLDEIGEMTPHLQAKLLRFLEEKTFRRVGGSTDIHVDVRVVAATNRNLDDEVRQGRFREDLFYRLNVAALDAAAAPRAHRRRAGARQLLRRRVQPRVQEERPRRVCGDDEAADDVRLAGQCARAAQRHRARDAPRRRATRSSPRTSPSPRPKGRRPTPSACRHRAWISEETEKSLVLQALERTGWNQTRAAKLLGLNRDQIHYRIEKFKLAPAGPKP